MTGRPAGWVLVALALLTGACRDKGPARRCAAPSAALAAAPAVRSDPPLARWLRQVPASAQWALASTDLDRLRSTLADAADLVKHHPRLAPVLRQWRGRLERLWGAWPLEHANWSRLGLVRAAGGVVFRRADGFLVAAFRSPDLGQTLEAIFQSLRRRGARPVAEVRKLRIGEREAFALDGWICATRGRLSWCANAPQARWAAVTGPPRRSLRAAALARVPGRYLAERLGLWLGREADFARPLLRAAGALTGWTPRGLWLAASAGRRLQVRALALAGPGQTMPAAPSSLPKPGHSGLAAASGAPLVIRLRLAPGRLAEHLHRLLPGLRPALELLRGQRAPGGPFGPERLNGEVVLLSAPAGLGAILGLRSRTDGQRAMKRLMLLFTGRIATWQQRVRSRGRGWDLTYTPASLGDVQTHRLTLRIPKTVGPRWPRPPDGRLTLIWGLTRHHLVVATDEHLFRRTLARVDQPDRHFVGQLGGAAGRQGFAGHRTLTAHLRPDDPLYALPALQRAALRRWLGEQPLVTRQWISALRVLVDLTLEGTLSCEELPAGLGCHLGITLLNEPGPGPGLRFPAAYREALVRKWGGNRDGHLRQLRALAAAPTDSPLRAKASRLLTSRRGVFSAGLEGLAASLWIPWNRLRRAASARKEAPRELARLARALQTLARQARPLPAAARRRWHRGLRSTRLTPARTCCRGGIRRCESRPTDWQHPTWRALGFQLAGAHYYRYQVLLEPGSLRTRVVLRALGDFDCNGRSSLLEQALTIDEATGDLVSKPLRQLRPHD